MKRATYGCMVILLWGCFSCTAVKVEVVSDVESDVHPPRVRPKAPIDPKDLPKPPDLSSNPLGGVTACPTFSNGINRKALPTPQGTDAWCWAASAEMVMRAHGTDVDQCSIVNRVQNRDGCCGANGIFPAQCWTNGWPDQAFEKFDYSWNYTVGPLDKDKVIGQLCNTGPFIYVLLYRQRGGHSIVVKDYQEKNGELILWIHDHRWLPGKTPRVATSVYPISYDDFRAGIWEGRRYNHALDYVEIKPLSQ